jgi:hypothetical protein
MKDPRPTYGQREKRLMKFDAIELSKDGNIRCSLRRWARNKQPFLSIVHVAFSGDYRNGSAGAPDAHYMVGITGIANEVWRPSALILDLRDVRYQWGDEMDLVLAPPGRAVAILVGPSCERAISTLWYGINTTQSILEEPHFFRDFEPAVDYVTRAMVADWNTMVEEHRLLTARPITVDDLLKDV